MKRCLRGLMLIAIAAMCLPTHSITHAQTPVQIKVLQWNVEDGEQPGEIDAIVAQKPDIVFLQEIDRPGHLDDIVAALAADQQTTWDVPHYISRYNTNSGASWIAILSKFPVSNVKTTSLSSDGENICGQTTTAARAAIGGTILVSGQSLAIFSTRNFYYAGDCPAQTQNRRFNTWVNANYAGMTHIYGGDFNMQPNGIAYDVMIDEQHATDAWEEAVNAGTATSFDGNPNFFTPTHNSRLDYLFYKNAGTVLATTSAQIPAGDASLSDHRMMIATFSVGSTVSTLTADLLPSDDVFIRGGSYANTNLNDPDPADPNHKYVATRASANDEYRRRVLLKFDTTPTNVPSGATIDSATLYVTLSYTNTLTRSVKAYDVVESGWVETNVTWNDRLPGTPWQVPGATLGSVRATSSIGTTLGTTYSFDVKSWVQTVVNGQQPGGSHWTRLALVDEDTSGTNETYKEFYSKEAPVGRELKPRLVVIYH